MASSPGYQRQLNKFKRQYLQLERNIIYPDNHFLQDANFQEALYEDIFSETALKHSPSNRYKLRILKELLRRIEESITDWEEQDVSDNLMTCLSNLMSIPLPDELTCALQKSYVTYTFSSLASSSNLNSGDEKSTPTIVLLEARNLVSSAGTTGLRTWDASLHLTTYLTTHTSFIAGKSILELGSGLGLLSILCARHLGASHVTCTDGSEEVMAELPTNFYLNDLADSPSLITTKELKWGHALLGTEESSWNSGRKIDVVLGADLIYDGEAVSALLSTLTELFEMFPDVKVLMAQCVRNKERFEEFLKTCVRWGFVIEEIQWEMKRVGAQEGPFYDVCTTIKLLMFSRNCTS